MNLFTSTNINSEHRLSSFCKLQSKKTLEINLGMIFYSYSIKTDQEKNMCPLKFLSKFLGLFVIISFTHFCSFIAVSRMTALFYIQTPGGAHCAGSTERYFGAQRKNKHLCCEANTSSTCVIVLLCTEAEAEDTEQWPLTADLEKLQNKM